jgi:hypothetical protein
MSSKQVLDAGLVRRSTDTSSTANQLQEAATRAQQALSNAATEVSQVLGLDNLPAPETLASELHNQSLSFARTVGQFVGQLQNEVSFVYVCIILRYHSKRGTASTYPKFGMFLHCALPFRI